MTEYDFGKSLREIAKMVADGTADTQTVRDLPNSQIPYLIDLLTATNIPFEINNAFGTRQVCYPSKNGKICDAICHGGSYGHERGLLEIMGLVNTEEVGDDVEGYLSAEEVFCRIATHYFNLPFDLTPKAREDEDCDCDWDYNEDEGFDPYEGCYTYDC